MKKVNTVTAQKVAHIRKHMKEVSYNLWTGEIFSHEVNDNQTGYLQFSLGGEMVYVHHFIAVAGKLDVVGKVVTRINGDRQDNSILNLEALTHAEVMKQAAKRGAFKDVIKAPKLTDAEVFTILELQEQGVNDYELGRIYGRDHMVFAKIRWGQSYKRVIAKRNRQMELMKRFGLPTEYVKQIQLLRKNGMSDRTIADLSGIGEAVVRQFD